jgi:hypothetical protein
MKHVPINIRKKSHAPRHKYQWQLPATYMKFPSHASILLARLRYRSVPFKRQPISITTSLPTAESVQTIRYLENRQTQAILSTALSYAGSHAAQGIGKRGGKGPAAFYDTYPIRRHTHLSEARPAPRGPLPPFISNFHIRENCHVCHEEIECSVRLPLNATGRENAGR